MNYDPKKSRLEAIASLALTAEHAGTIEGWRDYLSNEMKTVGLTSAEVKAEMRRIREIGGMCKQSE